ncbi:MAG TPA: winged helix-turn-helix domain-containing protein [Terriglobia bacterium]|nr:winged helix-turn-helix domain-containing protein [Terriglobia bacterium]
MNELRENVFVFGPFRLDAAQRMLRRNGEHLPLSPKEFETLLVLVERGGQLVGKEAIISRVWQDTFVSDSSLTRNISVLRKTLGEDVIQTLPKFGQEYTWLIQMFQLHLRHGKSIRTRDSPRSHRVLF